MSGMNGFYLKAAHVGRLAGFELYEPGTAYLVLLELVLYESYGQAASVYGNVQRLKKIRHSAYVVLVGMGYDETAQLRAVFNEL